MSRTLLEYPRDAITDEMCELLAPYFAPEDYNVDAAKKVCLLEKCVIWRLFLHCLRLVHWVPHLMFLVHIDAVGVIEERKCSVSVFSFFWSSEVLIVLVFVQASGSLAGLCTWTQAMPQYHEVAKFVAPKQMRLMEAQEQLDKAMGELRAAEEELAEKQRELDLMQANFDRAMAEKQRLEDDAELTKRRLSVWLRRLFQFFPLHCSTCCVPFFALLDTLVSGCLVGGWGGMLAPVTFDSLLKPSLVDLRASVCAGPTRARSLTTAFAA